MHIESAGPREPLVLPRSEPEPQRAGFPVVASIAPIGVSIAIWALTGSPLSLVFAGLSPIIAIAALVDGRRQARRRRRRGHEEWQRQAAALQAEIGERHRAERQERARRFPSSAAVAAAPIDDVTRWKAKATAQGCVVLGIGSVPSTVQIQGQVDTDAARELRALAATLTDTVLISQGTAGIGIVGSPVVVRAVARGYLLQLAHTLSPLEATIDELPPIGWSWAEELPHRRRGPQPGDGIGITVLEAFDTDPPTGESVRPTDPAPRRDTTITLVLASVPTRLPPECATVLQVSGPGSARIVTSADDTVERAVEPELICEEAARQAAARLAAHAVAAGLARNDEVIPVAVSLAELPPEQPSRDSLRCALGLGARGPLVVDLVSDGPHAIIAGTTGSGKSELLITWVASLARERRCDEVTFLLVDFKGGATFQGLSSLPHCVGVITDLDHREARRALESLHAELSYREGVLAAAAAKDIAELSGDAALARLVIVVDEYAAMIATLPELQTVFVDIAARGRSLGVHLILCTQRPTAVVRDALMANCGLRLSLRVNNTADSRAVLESEQAAFLSPQRRGLVIAMRAGVLTTAQIATTSSGDIRAIVGGRSDPLPQDAPRRPWLDPLPAMIPLERVRGSTDGFVLGVVDVPAEQRQDALSYRPQLDGSLLIVGMHGTGKSAAIKVLDSQRREGREVLCVARPIDEAWDQLCAVSTRCSRPADSSGGPAEASLLMLVDDVDSLFARLPDEYQGVMTTMMTAILREGPAHGVYMVVTAARVAGPLHNLVSLFGDTLVLRMPSKQEHVLAGGEPDRFDPTLPAGGGFLHGQRVQLAWAGERGADPPGLRRTRRERAGAPIVELRPGETYVLVTATPRARVESLSALACRGVHAVQLGSGVSPTTSELNPTELAIGSTPEALVVVGDADAWQGEWTLLAALRPQSTLIFDGCTLSEVRSISRRSTLPPPLGSGAAQVWVLGPEGGFVRARLPEPRESRGPGSAGSVAQAARASAVEPASSPRPEATAALVREPA